MRPGYYDIVSWVDAQNPVGLVAEFLAGARRIVVSDTMWAIHLLSLKRLLPDAEIVSLSDSLGGLRSVKTDAEMLALREAGWRAQNVMEQVQTGQVPLVGRTELAIAADITARLLAADHETVEFCIVGSGPNSASAHHHPGDRIVQPDEMVLFDFGGRHRNGFCSDITRCVWTGPIPAEVQATWDTLKQAQQAAVDAARPGTRLGDVDAAARSIIADTGCGPNFIHRTGHGIGTEVHEQPYVTEGSDEIVAVGHAFSIEPGMYFEGRWGMRLEDIVVIGEAGAIRCTDIDHNLVSVRA